MINAAFLRLSRSTALSFLFPAIICCSAAARKPYRYSETVRISTSSFQLKRNCTCLHCHLSLCVRKTTIWIPTRSDTIRAVQSLKMVRDLKFCIKVEEGLHYPCSENKGDDQLRGYREADLHLCFRPSILLVFPCSGSFSIF